MSTTFYPSLSTVQQIPEFLRSNEYIYEGYRVNFTKEQCIKSIFFISNETVNIWSHLLGVVLFLFLTWSMNDFITGLGKAGPQDHLVMTAFCLCFLCCLALSTTYHIFNCQSKEDHDYCFRLDLAGISISLCGIYFPSFFYGFYCFHFWRMFYTGSTFLLIFANVALQVFPRRIYAVKRDYRRISLFVVMVLFGIIPACHWVYLLGGFSHPQVQQFLPQIIVMYMIGGAAFFFYMTKLPEKLLPGYCDYIGSSHQWWHVLILAAFVWWYLCSMELLKFTFNDNNQC